MPKEPQLGDQEKLEQDNKDYSAPLKVPLADQKASLLSDIYGIKPKNTAGENTEKQSGETGIESIESKEKNPESDSPYFPMLKNLFESGYIDEKIFKETTEKFNEVDDSEEKKEFLKIVNNLPNSKVKNDIILSFNKKEEVTEKNFDKTEFSKDSKSLNIDLDKGVGGLEIMLAENYISMSDKEGNDNKVLDLSTSMDTSLNTILRGSSEDFLKQNGPLITEIKGEQNLNKKYKLLKDLYKEDLKRDAIVGGKRAKEEINRKKSGLMEEAKNITKEIKDAEKIADQEEKTKTLEKLNQEKQKIIEEGQGIDNFEAEVEALAGGEKDKSPDKIKTNETPA
ncbi:MAG: hypothetical protein PHH98_05765 [Candidatus Gracilibacteria bacterium]|nr:hypothetical protein [Candidatus Gracilibacteria bacterium]